jgi:hypothetical protein
LLNDGRVLVAGGFNGGVSRNSAELFDPATGTWTATGSMTIARGGHAATLLNDGRVLVVGGKEGSSTYFASTEIFDSTTATWTATGNLGTARASHTATLLSDGRVLVAGGLTNGANLSSTEVFDPAAGTWSATGGMLNDRRNYPAIRLNDGRVLVIGGDGSGYCCSELFTLTGGTPTPTPTNTPLPPNNTGFLAPTASSAATSSAGDNNGYEVSPSNAFINDGVFAADINSGTGTQTSCTNNRKDKHLFYNYNFNIPPTVTILGLEVQLDALADSTNNAPKLCVQISWNGGITWTTAKQTTTLGTAETTYILGDPADTWGRTWAVGDFSNANFRIRVIDVASNTSRDFYLDFIAVNVTYQP